jgi:hypothetical protein
MADRVTIFLLTAGLAIFAAGLLLGDDSDVAPETGDHWAYQPVDRSPPPEVQNQAWVRNPIDNFVLVRLEADGISPSPEADRYTLIKRLSYDLLGFPPEPEAVDAFVRDSSPDAYDNLVGRLLGSPHFGERWGRHWLDKARYADSDGYEKDLPRPHAWRYRDWVIEAINSDQPFDQFTTEQVAGDLLPDATLMNKLATAFHRQTLFNTEGGVDREEYRVEVVVDRTNTVGAIWLGHTVGCAQCHSHKYDRISQREYYQLFAFFNNGEEVTTELPVSADAVAQYKIDKAEHDRRVQEPKRKLEARRAEIAGGLSAWERETRDQLAENTVQFHPLEITQIATLTGVPVKLLEDGSALVAGRAWGDSFTVFAKVAVSGITGFRIEALTDGSLPGEGPGKGEDGNFVLSEFEVYAGGDPNLTEKNRVPLASAVAGFSQQDFPAAATLDNNKDSGWAIYPRTGKSHHITFLTESPIGAEAGRGVEAGPTHLKLVLKQPHGEWHTVGRFRITALTGKDSVPWLPPRVREILTRGTGDRGRDDRKPQETQELLECFYARDAKSYQLEVELGKVESEAPKRPVVNARVIAQNPKPRTTRLLVRGDFQQPAEEVRPGTLAVLHPFRPRKGVEPDGDLPDRLDLAGWLFDASNPLTPRVTVNHIWDHLFGQGLVRSTNDFGVRGDKPTHPQLLDWLASEFRRCKWSRKSMIRLIVGSATYRQNSRHRPELADVDPENHRLYRQNRFRMPAEVIRDLNLAASGLLARRIGGPSVFPPMPAAIAKLSYSNKFQWSTSVGSDRYRRGMYTFFKRTAPHPTLMTFDCPDANTSCVKRSVSNTPLQALALLNNEVFVEAAQGLARRVLAYQPVEKVTFYENRPFSPISASKILDDIPVSPPFRSLTWTKIARFSLRSTSSTGCYRDQERLRRAFRLCLARPPVVGERDELMNLLTASREHYAEDAEGAREMAGPGLPPGVSVAEVAAWVGTVRILMNFDEFVTRE